MSLLVVRNLKKYFPIRKGVFRKTVGHVRAVDGVSLELNKGESLGLVGESGCGKTTAGRCIIRLLDPTEGQILFGEEDAVDIADLPQRDLKAIRPRIQMIFQDPNSSLNPRMTVSDIVGEPLLVNRIARGKILRQRVADLLQAVGLRPEDGNKYPHAFSGGQRQRIGIARALALDPEVIIADEPVSALDVSVQAQIINLLKELREKRGLSFLFITHDLSINKYFSDRVAVMYLGKIVEMGPTEELYNRPRHPYTEALLSAVPIPDPEAQRRREVIRLKGDVPDPSHPPKGCSFHPRCPYVKDRCKTKEPKLEIHKSGIRVACHFADELPLKGVTQ